MKTSRYIAAAAILIVIVYLTYFVHFYVFLGYAISDDSEAWGQLGDFVGGILNPLLSFVSIALLIKSLSLQNEANKNLRIELKNNEKTEKLRSFEVLFFNLVNSQKNLFDSFRIEFESEGKLALLMGVEAVMKIEDDIEEIRKKEGEDQQVSDYLDEVDRKDQIFGLSRAFYIIVRMISEKLSDAEGFTCAERKAHYMSLVNFTDFAQLRLVMICVQFMDFESTKYLRSAKEFKAAVEELGLRYELY